MSKIKEQMIEILNLQTENKYLKEQVKHLKGSNNFLQALNKALLRTIENNANNKQK